MSNGSTIDLSKSMLIHIDVQRAFGEEAEVVVTGSTAAVGSIIGRLSISTRNGGTRRSASDDVNIPLSTREIRY